MKRTKFIFLGQAIRLIFLAFLIVLANSWQLSANPLQGSPSAPQDSHKKVTGTVSSKSDKISLPGVSVQIKGSSIGVATDINGSYTILVPDEESATLIFSFIGMKKQEIRIGKREVVNVVLEDADQMLDDVVVVGYQSVHKRNVTGSVSRVDMDGVRDIPAASISELLNGKIVGLQSLGSGGAPGSKNALVIRGSTMMSGSLDQSNAYSTPLYVIDGVPMSQQDLAGFDATGTDFLASINPADIESIDVLKDASASAIYGSRGANGVIIIKTKGGKRGKTEINVAASFGVTTRPVLNKIPIGGAERNIKMGMINRWWPREAMMRESDGLAIIALTDSLNPAFNNNVDYQDLFYRTGIVHNYDVALSGGTEEINYRLGLGYYDEKGIVRAHGYQRYSMNFNLGLNPYKCFRNNTAVRLSYSDRQTGQGDFYVHNAFPVMPQWMKSSLFELKDDQRDFIVGKLDQLYNTNRNIDVSVSNTANLNIWNGITLNSQIGVVYSNSRRNYFQASTLRDDNKGYANHFSPQFAGTNLETFLSYAKDVFKDHNLNILVGNTFDFNQRENVYIDAIGGSGDAIFAVNGYENKETYATTEITMSSMLSFWTRLGYRFKNRYMFEFNFRRDASSRFGDDSRWGNFPALSAGWVFSDEPFMKKTSSWLNYGKVKASWGRNGTQFYDDKLRYNMYELGAGSLGGGVGTSMKPTTYNGKKVTSPKFSQLADKGLSWEESTQWNVGLEAEFLNRRLFFTFDAYNRETKSLLFEVNFPAYTGFDRVTTNVAGIMNYGLETSLNAYVFDRASSHQIEIQGGLTHNNNKVTALPNANREYTHAWLPYGYSLGSPTPSFYGLEYMGPLDKLSDLPVNPYTGKPLDPTKDGNWGQVYPGYPVFRDVSGNYIVSDMQNDDLTFVAKNSNPKIAGFLNMTFIFKDWKLRANTQFAFKRDVYDMLSQEMLDKFGRGPKWFAYAMVDPDNYDFWTQEGGGGKLPALIPSGGGNMPASFPFRPSSMWWEDGSYWKINDLTLSYNVKEDFLKKIKLKRLYVYATMYNVWQWQRSKSVADVTVTDALGRSLGDGYPLPRKYVFGLNLSF